MLPAQPSPPGISRRVDFREFKSVFVRRFRGAVIRLGFSGTVLDPETAVLARKLVSPLNAEVKVRGLAGKIDANGGGGATVGVELSEFLVQAHDAVLSLAYLCTAHTEMTVQAHACFFVLFWFCPQYDRVTQ